MRYPEQRIYEVTGLTDMSKISMVENYMRDMYFYPRMLNSVTAKEFNEGARVSVKELEVLNWKFI